MEIDKKEYGKYVKQVTPVHNTWKNLWRAFFVGGTGYENGRSPFSRGTCQKLIEPLDFIRPERPPTSENGQSPFSRGA